jgi:hypothetical protein
MIRIRIILTALSAALALSLAAGTASALRSLSLSPAGPGTTLTLNGPISFEGNGLGEIICNVTMAKTVSSSIPKVENTLIGRVTDVRIAEPRTCRVSGGITAILRIVILGTAAENLWRLFYKAILGTLPSITGAQIKLEATQVLLEFSAFLIGLVRCLYEGAIEALARVRNGVIERLTTIEGANRTRLHPAELNSGNCPGEGKFKASLTPLQQTRLTLL